MFQFKPAGEQNPEWGRLANNPRICSHAFQGVRRHDRCMSQVSSDAQPATAKREAEFYAFQIFQSECAGAKAHFVRELRLRWDAERGRMRWDEEPVRAFKEGHEALDWYLRRKCTLAKSGFHFPTKWPSPLRVPEGCRLIL